MSDIGANVFAKWRVAPEYVVPLYNKINNKYFI